LALAQKPKRWVFQEAGQDSKLEKRREQAHEAQGRVIRLQSMLNRIERLELTEADFRDVLNNQDFLRGRDIFMDSDDRSLFEKACPLEFERIERRERAGKQEADKNLTKKTSALLLKKLDDKLSPKEQNSSSISSSTYFPVATEANTSETDSQARRLHLTRRALNDRKAYMVDALQMEIALMIKQHNIIDDYQSPVNGSMYSASPHRCIMHAGPELIYYV